MSRQKDKVARAITEIDEVVDLFYQQKLKTALDKLDGVLADISGAMDALFAYRDETEGFAFDEQKLLASLNEAMGALMDQDMVLLADVLQYDFREYLGELAEKMN